ncbi:alpha/beta hydrolase [Aphanothece hegewaldii CCALA 016]|uniref:Alpha/beta hydrolase n=1 Tax=Aphanothece hegewaldii CCALA 016 TaxID=2107694 RepID=A0A2T1LZD8_9CHRO|nr:alpha/beta fold hydrolase [Aphanothece hegewaldii]PSF37738.1 alpha/beta hydrolase [Aphanothece hegewaldii CCALA 016]
MQTTSVASITSVPGVYWQWRGQTIYYTTSGTQQEGKPPLLLVHGFGASTDHWRKNIAQLQQDFEVIAIDLLGFGRSAKANIEYSADLWRDQLYDFITEVIRKPVVLAGNSLGGYVSLCVAAKYPSSVAGLILLNSAGPFTEAQTRKKPSLIQNFIRYILLQTWASFFLFQFVRNRSNIRKTLAKVYVDQSAITDQLVEDIYRPSCDPGAAQVFAAVFKNPHGEKVDVLLKQMQCPLLMLWGEGDPWMKAKERGVKYREHYPNLTEYYLNAGHCPHDEIPEQVNQLIKNWILGL